MKKNNVLPKKSKPTFRHLTYEDRIIIETLLNEQKSIREIAAKLGCHHSTIYREIIRNTASIYNCRYNAKRAHIKATKRRKIASQRLLLKTKEIRKFVIKKLNKFWSPLMIAGRLQTFHPEMSVSHEAIYQFVYRERTDLIDKLYFRHRKRNKRGQRKTHRDTHIKDRVPIDKRPKSIQARKYYGHYEADTIVSKASKAAVAVLVERKSRFLFANILTSKTAMNMCATVSMFLKSIAKPYRKSVTYDNGSENSMHIQTCKMTQTKSYFCAPYHSWEKGTVERMIRDIRRYLPKGTDFSKVHPKKLKKIICQINDKPRKCLGFKTPREVFEKLCGAIRS